MPLSPTKRIAVTFWSSRSASWVRQPRARNSPRLMVGSTPLVTALSALSSLISATETTGSPVTQPCCLK